MEEIISQRAVSRYCKIVQSYKEALKSNPDLRFKAYCNETHTHYSGALDWLKRNGFSINEMRREARIEIQADLMPSTLSDSSSAPTFVQFQPRRSVQCIMDTKLASSVTILRFSGHYGHKNGFQRDHFSFASRNRQFCAHNALWRGAYPGSVIAERLP